MESSKSSDKSSDLHETIEKLKEFLERDDEHCSYWYALANDALPALEAAEARIAELEQQLAEAKGQKP